MRQKNRCYGLAKVRTISPFQILDLQDLTIIDLDEEDDHGNEMTTQ